MINFSYIHDQFLLVTFFSADIDFRFLYYSRSTYLLARSSLYVERVREMCPPDNERASDDFSNLCVVSVVPY